MDHYKNLPEAVSVPSVLDLKDDDHHDGRHQDRCGQHRQYRKHFEVPPSHNARERAERGFVPIKRVIQTKRPPTEAALLITDSDGPKLQKELIYYDVNRAALS